MATTIEAITADGRITRIELTGEDVVLPAEPGMRYRVVEAGGGSPDTLQLRRVDDDLVVDGLPEGERVRITRFFDGCGDEGCEFDTGTGAAVRPASEPMAALKDGSFLMWTGERIAADVPRAPESEFNWRPIGGIAAGLAVVGAGAGGGGGGSGSADTTAPDAPTLKTQAPTNNRFPPVAGTAEPNSTVTVTIDVGGDGANVTYSTTADGDGNWQIDLATQAPLAGSLPAEGLPTDRPSIVRAIATDNAGNSGAIAEGSISIDVVPPEQLAKITSASSDAAEPVDDQGVATNTNGAPLQPGPLADGDQTNDRSPAFAGSLDAPLADGDRLLIFRDGRLVGQATVDGQDWTFVDANVPSGTHTYEARVVDAAGNSAPNGNTFTLTVDGTPPSAPVIDPVAGDDIIDITEADAGVTISGTAEAGSRVTVTWGQDSRTIQVDADGRFSAVYTRAQLPDDGTIPVSAVAMDSFGNVGPAALRPVTLVTAPPDTPLIDTRTGILSGDPIAINAAEAVGLAITGTATPGNRVSLSFTPVGGGPSLRFEGTTGVDGKFSVPIARNALPDGTYQVQALATDIVGNEAPGARVITVLVDTQIPTAIAAVDAALDDAPRLTGTLASGAVTNDTSPTLSGAVPAGLAPGDGILVQRDGSPLGEARIEGDRFVFTDADLVDGRYAYAARVIDAAGNVGAEGAFFELTVDATAPAAPAIATVSGDDVVSAAEFGGNVAVTGSAAAAAAVEVSWGGTTRTVTSDAGGNWVAVFDSPPQGRNDVRATVVDEAGNTASTTRSVVFDTIAPGNPEIFAPEGGNDTINAAEASGGVSVSGRAEPGARIELDWGGRGATASANGQGFWSTNFSSVPGQGSSTITAVAVDGVGNRSGTSSRAVTVDTQAPAAPRIDPVTGDDRISVADAAGGITITGQAESGARVRVDWAGQVRETVAGGGSWSVSYGDAPVQGPSQISVRATDAAGNTGATTTRSVTANTIPPPPAPGIDAVAGDNVVNEAEAAGGVTITGSAQPGSTVEVSWGGETESAAANGAGRWSVTFAERDVPADGNRTVSATASNSGGASAPATLAVTVDTTAPGRPGITVAGNNEVSADEGEGPIQIVGSSEPGATVSVVWGGITQTATASGAGNWSVTYGSLPVGEGRSTVEATATDAAGNTGRTANQSVTVDPQRPDTPAAIANVLDDQAPGVGGVASGGTTNDDQPELVITLGSVLASDERVEVTVNGSALDRLQVTGSGTTYETDDFDDGVYEFRVQVVDIDSGLTGPLSDPYTITINTL